jgi:hypothetical protein
VHPEASRFGKEQEIAALLIEIPPGGENSVHLMAAARLARPSPS